MGFLKHSFPLAENTGESEVSHVLEQGGTWRLRRDLFTPVRSLCTVVNLSSEMLVCTYFNLKNDKAMR